MKSKVVSNPNDIRILNEIFDIFDLVNKTNNFVTPELQRVFGQELRIGSQIEKTGFENDVLFQHNDFCTNDIARIVPTNSMPDKKYDKCRGKRY